jgi:hypothetical protein
MFRLPGKGSCPKQVLRLAQVADPQEVGEAQLDGAAQHGKQREEDGIWISMGRQPADRVDLVLLVEAPSSPAAALRIVLYFSRNWLTSGCTSAMRFMLWVLLWVTGQNTIFTMTVSRMMAMP